MMNVLVEVEVVAEVVEVVEVAAGEAAEAEARSVCRRDC
jgi:hypothetical protein